MPGPRRLLVVDDEIAIRDSFASLSKRFGYPMEFHVNGARALEAVALDPAAYGLVISDVRMPEMDGLSFVRSLRGLCPKIGVILMTGELSDDVREGAEAIGNVVFLEKPFQLEKLFKETIPTLINR